MTITPPDKSQAPHSGEISPLDDSSIVIHGPLHGSPEGGLSSEYPVRSPTPPPSREAGTARLLASLKAADG
ncbi:MAG TPA: hypothetical protein VMY38_00500, partial [Gemmatimonadaceae bacterium]|nr:hypothetical protein [Gemmatimonadaceae bacterium]